MPIFKESIYTVQEMNTIITMLGCLCAVVQASTGIYAALVKKKTSLLRTNANLNRAHRAFGGFATTLYFLGLFAGLSGFIGALLGVEGSPPLEYDDASFNIHTWASFPIMVIVVWKTVISYFKKKAIFKRGKWLGIATFIAWAYTWITSAFSYYIRTTPANPQHDPPVILLPIELLWLQILLPFIIGGLISIPILKSVNELEIKKAERLKKRKEIDNNK